MHSHKILNSNILIIKMKIHSEQRRESISLIVGSDHCSAKELLQSKSFNQNPNHRNVRRGITFAVALLLCLSFAPQLASASDDSGEGYYDIDVDTENLAQRLADMPDLQTNTAIDATIRKQLLDKYSNKPFTIEVDSIEPEGGPTTGQTRVLVRGGPFKDMGALFPKPKCKFGRNSLIVDATYVLCSASPTATEEQEGRHSSKNESCLQCENSPESLDAEIVPFTVSLLGDFSDTINSVPYRYFKPTRVYGIYPRYGPKDGQTFVQVWGENFLNFDENTRCNFGSKSVIAHFISSTFMTCLAPFSDVVEKAIPFSISLNKQQNSRDKLEYFYYNWPQVTELVPNYGPDSGGNRVLIKGANFMPFNFTDDIDNSNDTFVNFEGIGKVKGYVINSNRMYCDAPASYNQQTTIVEVTLNNQQYSDDNTPYFYYKPPQVFDAEPREGSTRGGTEVHVFGSKFEEGKNITCKFGAKTSRGVYVDSNRITCTSPQVERAGYVPLSISYEGEKYSSDSIKYLYYDTPEIFSITPICGPATGYTQITVIGKNFIDMGFGKVKCIFNNTYFMNATILEQDIIKCDSPPFHPADGFVIDNGTNPWYNLSITLNGNQFESTNIRFTYYVDPQIDSISPALGPIKGGTISKIFGERFAQDGVCNLTVRFGAIQQKLGTSSDKVLEVISPTVQIPDAVVVSVSLNGQQFIRDKTLHFRDIENTFTYIQDIFVQDLVPKNGPISGKTRIKLTGLGFNQFKDNEGKLKIPQIWVRFRDSITENMIGEITLAIDVSREGFYWKTPAADLDTKAILEFSFNQQDWQAALIIPGQNYSYQYYNAPKITSIFPIYGSVKSPNNEQIDINGRYFQCPESDCKDLWVKFGENENAIFVKGVRISDEKLRVAVPKYSKPDVLNVEVTFNNQDYTHDNQTYGFFDPFVLDVQPRLISTTGSTKIRLIGFGFVNAGDDLKANFQGENLSQLLCQGTSCIQQAQYIDKNVIESSTYPQQQVAFKDTNSNIQQNGMIVEASVTGGTGFTDNGIEIWYYETPNVISLSVSGSPLNQEKPIFVKTDFKWNINSIDRLKLYGNFTCRFTSRDGRKVVYRRARMEIYPIGNIDENTKPSHIRCSSPIWNVAEEARLDVSLNGQEYIGDFTFTFYEAIDLYRIIPMSGPNSGNTRVKLIGSGFQREDVYAKWGIIQTQQIMKDQVLDYIWGDTDFLQNAMVQGSEILMAYKKELYGIKKVDTEIKDKTKLNTYITQSPRLPNQHKTHGGPMYMAIGENFIINRTEYMDSDEDNKVNTTVIQEIIHQYSNSKVEFYYYKQPVVKKIEPNFGLTKGGTHIEISGAWFAYRPEYGVVPHCKIGDKISRAKYFSTVRIVCTSAPNDDINTLYPVSVSLNGVDFIDTGFTFRFFEQPKLIDMTPQCGPETGGTQITITGAKFSNISDPWNFKCRFSSQDRDIPPKFIPAYYVNSTSIICSSPGGWGRGDSVKVQVTFNGEDYSDNNFTFYYYNVVKTFPRSGPSDGSGGPIRVEGSGFRKETTIYCSIDKVFYEPIEIHNELILCPMPKAKQGPNFFGNVDFAVIIDGNWHKFTGGFQYYEQIIIEDIYPKIGPSEGKGIIKFYGSNFREDFLLAEIGCKIGDAVGKGRVVDSRTINCTVEEMSLVDEGYSLPATVSLNSYSWPETNQSYTPYGVNGIFPNSGPYAGNTDILITGKGFNDDYSEKARCRFGIPSNYAIVEAEILSYDKLICRSPPEFKIPPTSDETISIPIGVSFVDDEFEPWTESIHRFRYYKQPILVKADPDEIEVGKMAEILIIADEDSEFWEPIPTSKSSLGQYGIECKFGRFGIGMGMYVNKTAIKCVTPSITEDPEDIWRETVKITVALNGQDFDEETSEVDFTFVGQGSTLGFWPYVIGTLLIGLLLIALIVFCSAFLQKVSFETVVAQKQEVRKQKSKPWVIRDPYDQFTSRAYSAGMMGRQSSRQDGAFSQ